MLRLPRGSVGASEVDMERQTKNVLSISSGQPEENRACWRCKSCPSGRAGRIDLLLEVLRGVPRTSWYQHQAVIEEYRGLQHRVERPRSSTAARRNSGFLWYARRYSLARQDVPLFPSYRLVMRTGRMLRLSTTRSAEPQNGTALEQPHEAIMHSTCE